MPVKFALKFKSSSVVNPPSDVLEITTLLANPCLMAHSAELTLDHLVLRLCGKATPS